MKYVKMIPLFFYLLVAYNGMAVLGHPGHELALQTRWMAFPLISGREFLLNGGDVLLILGVGALYFEILKSTANTVATIIDHMASMLIFVVYLVEFIVVPAAGTSVFFILMMMSLLDVVGGFTVSISTARRDMAITGSM